MKQRREVLKRKRPNTLWVKHFFQGELFKQSLGKHYIYLIQKDFTQDKSRQTLSCHHSPEEANLEIWSVQVPPVLGVVLWPLLRCSQAVGPWKVHWTLPLTLLLYGKRVDNQISRQPDQQTTQSRGHGPSQIQDIGETPKSVLTNTRIWGYWHHQILL